MNVSLTNVGFYKLLSGETVSFQINLSKPQTLMVQRLLIIKGLGTCKYPFGSNPNGLDTIHAPKAKNGGAAPRQILDVQLFDDLH
jgi:hypothetical protein